MHLVSIEQHRTSGVKTRIAVNQVIVALYVYPAIGGVGAGNTGGVKIIAAYQSAGGAFLDINAFCRNGRAIWLFNTWFESLLSGLPPVYVAQLFLAEPMYTPSP